MPRVDTNHLDICATLRRLGATVVSTAALGHAFPEAVVGYRGHNYLIRIKDARKRWELDNDQEDFHSSWKGQIVIIDSIDAAVEWINGFA